jgi:hypothetical protein
MRRQRRSLARARRLYVRLCRAAIALDGSGDVLEYCAGRMLDAGMYAECVSRKNALQNIRYAILRAMWRYDYAQKLTWHEWTFKNAWTAHSWRRNKAKVA